MLDRINELSLGLRRGRGGGEGEMNVILDAFKDWLEDERDHDYQLEEVFEDEEDMEKDGEEGE